ncbi:ABC-type sugar transporter, permease component [Ferroplasma acidiphilum]|uniref:ABC-type sugar transporter, permease component n=1 Tax=Ferroplasma acidiphilum TaxID=74969 RepID=A0A1V0N496_9ARCH|nr:sugar ABC transporter permease [Ferroplasma acidiphilum]ARD84909.1 ABC-type sugar transporter, permease component [Ferroplasma acidiphilum]
MQQFAKNKFNFKKNAIFLILVPSFVYLLIFFIYPIFLSIKYSFTNLSLYDISHYAFTEFTNYKELFTSHLFLKSIYITIIFLIFSAIIGQMFLGSIIAYLITLTQKYFKIVVTTVILIAWATPQVTAGIMWYSTLSYIPDGTINFILTGFGLHSINFLSIHNALYSIIIANIWIGLGFSVLIFLGGIQGIDPSIIKASYVDGAKPFRRFFSIIFPLLKKSIITDLLLITLFTFGTFTLIYVLTAGGPAGSTELLTIYQYNTAFSLFSLGLANAIGVIIIIIALGLSLIYLKFIKVN